MGSTDRRSFILAAMAGTLAGCNSDAERRPTQRASSGVFVPADQDRRTASRTVLGGLRIDSKLVPEDSGDALLIIEHSDTARGGPARHLHHTQDEWFYVVQGAYVLEVGDERFELGPGDSAFAPRAIPHVWAHVSDGEGRLLIAFQPAGLMDSFFAALEALGSAPSQAELQPLFESHGMTVVGPPLPV